MAKIAGVADRIRFVHGSNLEVLSELTADSVFFDGQWAGPDPSSGKQFGLADFRPNGRTFLELAFSRVREVILRTPPHFDFSEIDSLKRSYQKEATLVENTIRGFTVYFDVERAV